MARPRQIEHDTSHYAHCATLMLRYKRNHMLRLLAMAVLLYINFFIMTVVWCNNDPTASIREVNYISENKTTVSLGMGLGGVLFMAISFVAGILVFRKAKSNKIRFGYLIGVVAVEGLITMANLARAPKVQMEGGSVDHLAFGYGMLALVFSGICLALAFFGSHEYPKLYIALFPVILLAILAGCYQWIIGALLILLFLTAAPEYTKMKWIRQQPGYPYFNERFQEQLVNSDYIPDHELDGRSFGVMESVDGTAATKEEQSTAREAYLEEQREKRGPQAVYTMHMSDNPAEMPGIDEIMEVAEPLPEPELPRAEDIPDTKWDMPEPELPKWDVPDPSPIPDPVTDSAVILSEVPDIAGDIPDLPELPDIPQI